MPLFTERLQGVVIEQWPALQLIERFDSKQTLYYVDPPYVKSTRASHVTYHYEMTDDEHRVLAATLHRIEGMVVLSGYRTKLYDELFETWQRVDIDAYGLTNTKRRESLWLSPATTAALHPKLAL